MDKKLNERAYKTIDRLVREDKDRGLERFRKGNFEQRVRAATAGLNEKRVVSVRRVLAPISAAIVLLIAVGVVWRLSRRATTSPQGAPTLAEVLGELPGASDLILPREPIPAGATPEYGMARAVRTVLARLIKQKAAEERKAVVPAGPLKVPRLSLEEKMEILFKEKAIERVLVSMFRKFEEV